jgi:hypothetical protein
MSLPVTLGYLHTRLNTLRGLHFHLNGQLEAYRKLIRDQTASLPRGVGVLGMGTALVIRDLTEWPPHGWAVHYGSGHFVTRGEEFLATVDLLLARSAALAVSQAFEVFETFLRDTAARLLTARPSLIDARQSREAARFRKSRPRYGRDPFWRVVIRRVYRSNSDALLVWLRSAAPHLKVAELRNNRAINLRVWFRVFTAVRHAVTHTASILPPSSINGLTRRQRQYLARFFPGRRDRIGYHLTLTDDNVEEVLRLAAEYGYAIFKAEAIVLGLEWRVLIGQGSRIP